MPNKMTPEQIFESAKTAARKQHEAEVKARDAKTARLKAQRLAQPPSPPPRAKKG